MQVELPVSKIKVDLIEKIGWGVREKIKAAMMGKIGVDMKDADQASISGDGLFQGKLRAMQVCITKMTAEDGTEVKFTEDWLDTLDQEDGDALYLAIDELAKGKKA
jgi:hypothetical protein